MPVPNHSNNKKIKGKRLWFKRRNVQRDLKRRKDANDLAFIQGIKKSNL